MSAVQPFPIFLEMRDFCIAIRGNMWYIEQEKVDIYGNDCIYVGKYESGRRKECLPEKDRIR